MAEAGKSRLVGWKTIGAFVGRDARTAKRWEVERGLPVYRTPGGARPTVWADRDELQRWMAAGRVSGASAAASTALGKPSRRGLIGAAGAALALVGVAIGYVQLRRPGTRSAASAYDDDPAARDLYLAAQFAWASRTPHGLATALADFKALTAKYPDRAPAWAGLAECYVLLREFGTLPSEEGYALARGAANKALAIDPRSVPAIRALAFLTFYWLADVGTAFRLFEQAVALAPDEPLTHHWFANALAARAKFSRARAEMDTARRLDPASIAIVADDANLKFVAGDADAGRRMLQEVVALHPNFSAAHRYLAAIAAWEDRDAEFLQETEIDARLRGDAALGELASRSRAVLPREGVAAMRRGYAEGLQALCAGARASPYSVAGAWARAGDADAALRWLEICRARSAANLVCLPADMMLRKALGHDARFQALLRQV